VASGAQDVAVEAARNEVAKDEAAKDEAARVVPDRVDLVVKAGVEADPVAAAGRK
jgi:hypothetical protein